MQVLGFVGQHKSDKPTRFLLRVLNRRFRGSDLDLLAPGLADGVEPLSCALIAGDLLRLLIDKWIESGMAPWSASGKTGYFDSPFERIPWMEVLEDFFMRNPPRVLSMAEGLCLVVVPRVFTEQKAQPSWLAGQTTTSLLAELGRSDSLEAWQVREMLPRIAPIAADIAVSLYLQWMDTPERAKLFRCDGCVRYFLRSRQPSRKTPIKTGSWCRRCQPKGAILRVVKSRKERRDRRLRLTADVWPLWTENRSGTSRPVWIAEQVNTRLESSGDQISRNWVTGHRGEIEAEVERRKHAAR